MKKRGQLGSVGPIIGTLVLIGILVAAGFYVLQEFLEQDSLTDTAGIVTNESGGYINATGYTLDQASKAGFNTPVITLVHNNTDAVVITSGNYTISSAGVLTNASATNWVDVNVSYTYNYGEEAYTSINDTIEAMTTVPELLGLIILIAMVGIILAVIFNVIPGVKGSSA